MLLLAEVDRGSVISLLVVLFSFFLRLFSAFCSFAPLLDMLDFAVCPDAFPHKKYMKRIKKKQTFGLFFTVVSLLYNNIVRTFLEF